MIDAILAASGPCQQGRVEAGGGEGWLLFEKLSFDAWGVIPSILETNGWPGGRAAVAPSMLVRLALAYPLYLHPAIAVQRARIGPIGFLSEAGGQARDIESSNGMSQPPVRGGLSP